MPWTTSGSIEKYQAIDHILCFLPFRFSADILIIWHLQNYDSVMQNVFDDAVSKIHVVLLKRFDTIFYESII